MKKGDPAIVVEQLLDASIDTVWSAITEVDQMRRWYFENIASFKAEVGFETQFEVRNEGRIFPHHWKVTRVVPLKTIEYHWSFEGYPGDSVSSFELFKQGGSTRLRLTARIVASFPDGIPEFTRESCIAGWTYFITQRLRKFLKETRGDQFYVHDDEPLVAMNTIRRFEKQDWNGVWVILEPIFRAGETYAYPLDISEEDARRRWTGSPNDVFVADDPVDGQIVGTYYLKPNYDGPGAHVCNCGYAVSTRARGKGIASLMCVHSQEHAASRGFLAMQFNLVVASNEGAVRLWTRLGFRIVGTLPGAFRHPSLGFVDAHIMYKPLRSTAQQGDATSATLPRS